MKRIAIIIDKELGKGKAANLAAILMGQASLLDSTIYDKAPVLDIDGNYHSSVLQNIILLQSSSEKLKNFNNKIKDTYPDILRILFTHNGQMLSYQYEEYKEMISHTSLENLQVAGIILIGEYDVVKDITKKFSILQ